MNSSKPQRTSISRRQVLASSAFGAAGFAASSLISPDAALAALSSAAGVVAGGSVEGSGGPIHFSALGTRIMLEGDDTTYVQGAFMWYDPAGLDGTPLTLVLVTLADYARGQDDNVRQIAGTVSINGEGEYPFALWLTDNGPIGEVADMIRLEVGSGASEALGTPAATPATDDTSELEYSFRGDLTAGDVQLVTLV